MIVRKAQLDDLKELQKLFVETVKSICSLDYNKEQIDVWTSSVENVQRWDDILTNQIVIVAQFDDKIVGFASLRNMIYIDLLYVHKDYQGQGIAKKLYITLEEIAFQHKQPALNSDVSITARPFFESVGFEAVTEQIVIRQGVELTNFKMMKTLASQ